MGKDVKIGIGVALCMVLLVFILLLARSGEEGDEGPTVEPAPTVTPVEPSQEQWTSLRELELTPVEESVTTTAESEATLEMGQPPTAAESEVSQPSAGLPVEVSPPMGPAEAAPAATAPPAGTAEAEAPPAPAPLEVSPQAAPQPRTYTTQAGDNLWKLAQRFYGDGRRWKVIYEANRDVLPSSSEVPVGVVLVIPAEGGRPGRGALPARLSAEAPVKPQPTEGTTYTVRQGDTLFSIARKHYGDGTRWRLIYEANRDRLSDPDRLQVGTVLVIPPKPAQGK